MGLKDNFTDRLSKVKDSAKDTLKNKALDSAQNAVPEDVQKAYKNAKRTAEITKRAVEATKSLVTTIGSLLGNPYFYIVLAVIAVALAGLAALSTWGPTSFGQVCSANGAPDLYKVQENERGATAASYVVGDKISKNAAGYIGALADENDFSYSNIKDCDTDCLIGKIDSGETVSIGAFGFTGEKARNLLLQAKNNGVDWTDSTIQLETIKNMLNLSNVNFSDDIEEAIAQVNKVLGKSTSRSDIVGIAKDAKKLADKVEEDTTCKVYGDGKGKGRFAGANGNTDNDGSMGNCDADFDSGDNKKAWEETENSSTPNTAGMRKNAGHVVRFLMKLYSEVKTWGTIRGDSDGVGTGHADGLAVDIMVNDSGSINTALGNKIAKCLEKNYDKLKVSYIIWDQKFFMKVNNIHCPANEWCLMADRGSPTQNHKDHVHVSFKE